MVDVLVIGGGMAGVTAALAAKQSGCEVAVASRSWGATALSTGALDIAYTPALAPEAATTRRTLRDHIDDILLHRPRHPYGVLGRDATCLNLSKGYACLQQILRGTGLDIADLNLDAENKEMISSLGTLIPAASACAPQDNFILSQSKTQHWGIVQLVGDSHFDARRVAIGMRHDAKIRYGLDVELQPVFLDLGLCLDPFSWARYFDDLSHLEEVLIQLKAKSTGLAGLIVPPVFGLQRFATVLKRMREGLGIPVVEALAHMPSVPGVRLQHVLDNALEQAGIARLGDIVSFDEEGGRVTAVHTADDLRIAAKAYVLASGRFITGGVVWDDKCREALFHLPVVSDIGWLEEGSPHPVVRKFPVQSHPLMTAGIKVNKRLQPIREERVAYDNLFAAGMVLGGFASRYTLCADGVALCTGWLAGQAAAGERP